MNRAIYDIPKREFDETLAELTTLLELGELVQRPTRQLSLGERMKCELVAALLHRPQRAVPRRADHRPRRVDAGDPARLHPRLQRALRRHRAADQPLHGRRGRALPARHRHRQGAPHLRRRARRAGAQGAAAEARDRASHSTASEETHAVPRGRAAADDHARCWRAASPISPSRIRRSRRSCASCSRHRATPRERDLRARCCAPIRRCCASGSPRRSPIAPSSWSGC